VSTTGRRTADLSSRWSGARDRLWLVSRPLAADEHRALFWERHLQLGVVLTELAVAMVVAYVIAAGRPHRGILLTVAVIVMISTPALLLVPMRRLARDHRGALVFYAWSAAVTVVLCGASILDGGASSPVAWLLVLTLAYSGLTYPPLGVGLVGSFMVLAYVVVALSGPHVTSHSALVTGVLVLLTTFTARASRNHWDVNDEQLLLRQQLQTLAETDSLTSLLNRRAFRDRLRREIAGATPASPLSLCLIDLDGFKLVNDHDGHAAGDDLLVSISTALMGVARETDHVGRLGGDEFALLLPGVDVPGAAAIAERVQACIAQAGGRSGVTASIGVVTTLEPVSCNDLLTAADQLMYQAKATGRSQVVQRR
jgi:diguanylate cyclase (GGDEF)-like protein